MDCYKLYLKNSNDETIVGLRCFENDFVAAAAVVVCLLGCVVLLMTVLLLLVFHRR